MGIFSLHWPAVLSSKKGACVAILAAAAAVSWIAVTADAAPAQNKNAQPPSFLRQNPSDPDEIPLTREDIEEKKLEAARAVLVKQMRSKAVSEVQAAAQSVSTVSVKALAKALRVEKGENPDPTAGDPAVSAVEEVGDLDEDGIPEVLVRWSRSDRFQVQTREELRPLPDWVLFLLWWDGKAWGASELMTGGGIYSAYLLPHLGFNYALAIVAGLPGIPYPVVFRFEGHTAALAWDSREESSRYQGYAQGDVQFKEREGDAPPAMIVSGRADPGIIRFSPEGSRGFEVATVYYWEGGAYIPRKSEFEDNEDYTLYRFLSALHLRDFRLAYALIDPSQFLQGADKTVQAFRKQVEEHWPEFIGNSLFQELEGPEVEGNKFAFELNRHEVRYTYFPTFSKDGKPLLTGLERKEQK